MKSHVAIPYHPSDGDSATRVGEHFGLEIGPACAAERAMRRLGAVGPYLVRVYHRDGGGTFWFKGQLNRDMTIEEFRAAFGHGYFSLHFIWSPALSKVCVVEHHRVLVVAHEKAAR